MNKRLSTLLKVGITVAGLAIVLWRIPAKEIFQVLREASWNWVLVAFLLVVASLFLRAFRWQILLRGLKAKVGYLRLVELYFAGNFFNAFLLSGFGGDVVRILEVARDVPGNVATGTVIVDRITGLVMLFVMALLVLPFRPEGFSSTLTMVILVSCLAGLIASFILLEGSLIRRFGRWLPGKLSPTGDGPVARVLEAVQGCGWRAIAGALGVSAIFNLMLVGWWYSAGRALGYEIPYTHYLLVVPLLSMALLVPSVGGLGVRELLAPYLFSSAALESSDAATQAVALSLLVFIIMRMASLLGAPVYILSTIRRGHQTTAEHQDEPLTSGESQDS
ncbi:MAG TPA: lysylphosphatidylglycerol synthase transmembrane domain-containing protein [candidate division Zixibacteria bacterium]|nr:lysylphosphatidylglycerol synthase transmembrane domain-containing protein [candidate division Zixibacteria bacterium]